MFLGHTILISDFKISVYYSLNENLVLFWAQGSEHSKCRLNMRVPLQILEIVPTLLILKITRWNTCGMQIWLKGGMTRPNPFLLYKELWVIEYCLAQLNWANFITTLQHRIACWTFLIFWTLANLKNKYISLHNLQQIGLTTLINQIQASGGQPYWASWSPAG